MPARPREWLESQPMIHASRLGRFQWKRDCKSLMNASWRASIFLNKGIALHVESGDFLLRGKSLQVRALSVPQRYPAIRQAGDISCKWLVLLASPSNESLNQYATASVSADALSKEI